MLNRLRRRAPTPIEGYLEGCHHRRVSGWAWRPSDPAEVVELRVEVDGRSAVVVRADAHRGDLAAAGKRDGQCAFEATLPEDAPESGEVRVRVIATGEELPGGPLRLDAIQLATGEPAGIGSNQGVSGEAAQSTSEPPSSAQPELANAEQEEAPPPPALRASGHVDRVWETGVQGWAWFPDAPELLADVEVLVAGQVEAIGKAELFRADLEAASLRGGHCAFEVFLPLRPVGQEPAPLQVRVVQTGEILHSPEPLKTVPPRGTTRVIEGYVDAGSTTAVRGWLWHPERPDIVPVVEVWAGGEMVAAGPADQYRADLAAHGKRDGHCAFEVRLPENFANRPVRVRLKVRGHADELLGGEFTIAPPIRTADPASRFDLRSGKGIEGFIDRITETGVRGWVYSAAEPTKRLQLSFYLDERFAGSATASELRKDLEAAGKGDGRCAFRFTVPGEFRDGRRRELDIRLTGSADSLLGGPVLASFSSAEGTPGKPSAKPETAPSLRNEVDCPGYLDDQLSIGLLGRCAWEHLAQNAGRMGPDRLMQRLVNRLKRERLFASAEGRTAVAALVVLPGSGDPSATTQAWALQSHPGVDALVSTPTDLRRTEGAEFVLFARPGDLIHPSAAIILARTPGADVVMWNRFLADEARAGAPGTLHRRPEFDAATVRHGAVTDTTFAVRATLLAKAPAPVTAALSGGRMHPLLFWLAGQEANWVTHPEALTSSVGAEAPQEPAATAADKRFFEELLVREGERFTLQRPQAESASARVLVPARRPRKVSVLIGFRDRSALTLRCIYSLARQHLTGELELVLVDNQSTPDEARRVLVGAQSLLGPERVKLLCYDAPFNHSAQNNLAAEHAQGEVVVICNNDVEVQEPTTLEQISAWALQPGIGTVGCRLDNPDRKVGSYGHVMAEGSDNPFTSPLAENTDPTFGEYVHAVPGNTLAFAAIARDRFLELGGLDASRFPVGYNDVEFMLRASGSGLRHLYLGHLTAEHRRGASRSSDNEDVQALWTRQLHPAQAGSRFLQLTRERVEPAAAAGTSAGLAGGPRKAALEAERQELRSEAEALQASLEGAIGARRGVELQRARLAEQMTAVSDLAGQLADAVSRARAATLSD